MKMLETLDRSFIDEGPLSPAGRMFHQPMFDCCIVAVIGWKTNMTAKIFKAGLQQTLVHTPRYSSKMVVDHEKGGKMRWAPATVNIDDHVIVSNIDPNNITFPDKFLEDYVHDLTKMPLNKSRPLWEAHLLNVKTSDAECVTVFKIHHSMGDGASLISGLLACCRKSSDPHALPTIPAKKSGSSSESGWFWWIFLVTCSFLRMIFNTFVDVALFTATSMFLKDTETPITGGGPGAELNPKRIVHKTVSLEDIKLIKNAMNMTINDVLLGVAQAALSQYLNRRYGHQEKNEGEKKKSNIPSGIRVRAIVLVNLRPITGIQALADMIAKKSKCKWGNKIGYILLPFKIGLENNPLDYVRKAKATMDRKKLSLGALCLCKNAQLLLKIFGEKVTTGVTHKVLCNTTLAYSNVIGPYEEVSFFGHQMAYLAAGVYGHPQALMIHFQSYANKMTITLSVDPNVIPDPHQLCEDIVESLKVIKNAAIETCLNKDEAFP